MTSLTEVRVEEPPTRESPGRGTLVFTDSYSLFGWGEMPDTIPKKGASRCAMGAYTFERLEEAGVPTHYRGVVQGDAVVDLEAAETPPKEMAIDLTRVPNLPHADGDYVYEDYHREAGAQSLVPLQIVYRNSIPTDSTLRSRTDPEEYDLDFEEWPDEPVDLPDPSIEFLTKFEVTDRSVDREEADRIAGEASLDRIEELAREANRVVTDRADALGLTHLAGRMECVYDDGTLKMANVTGTLDENRFHSDGQTLSKDVLRECYRESDPDWVDAVEDAKIEARVEGDAEWRPRCEIGPKPLPGHVITAVSRLYGAGANAYTGQELFDGPSLEVALAKLSRL